jgi:hypothetical protein
VSHGRRTADGDAYIDAYSNASSLGSLDGPGLGC